MNAEAGAANAPEAWEQDALPPCRTWTVRQAASALGVSVQLLRSLIREGYLPVIRLGRRVLVRRSTVERLLAEPQGEDARITQLVQARRDLVQEQTRMQARK